MSRSVKLALDVLLGAVVPILVLTYLSEPSETACYAAGSTTPGSLLAGLFTLRLTGYASIASDG